MTSFTQTNDDYATMKVVFVCAILLTLSYGIYLSITAMSMYLLLKKWSTYPARIITASYIGCMFILATPSYIAIIHVSTWAFVDAVYAMSINEDIQPPPLLALQTFCKTCVMLQYLLSDGILVFRVCKTWNGKLVVMIPLMAVYFVSIVSGILFETSSFSPFLTRQYAPLRSTFILSTILCNAFSISAIALRIFPILRDSKSPNNSFKTRAGTTVYIFLQNGALYVLFGVFAATIWLKFPSTPLDTLTTVIWQILVLLGPATCVLCVLMGQPVSIRPDDLTYPRSDDFEKSPSPHSVHHP